MNAPTDRHARFRLAAAPLWMIDGTSKRCYAAASYAQVVAHLGQPRKRTSDPGKVRVEWVVHTPHGPVAVYEYRWEIDPRAVPYVEADWHIGAHNDLAARWVAERICTPAAST